MAIKKIIGLFIQKNNNLQYDSSDKMNKKEKPLIEKVTTSNTSNIPTNDTEINCTQTENLSGDMTQDLMQLIGSAIEEWSRIYHLENLPKEIIFQQALAALNAMNKLFESKK